MNNEQIGEPVFGNVDEALADRIISRSMENSKEPEPSAGLPVSRINKPQRRSLMSMSMSIMKIVIPAVLVLIALWVYVVNSKSNSIKYKSNSF
jgi:hypothetical protein